MLQPAHQGYLYQDIVTACVLVRALVERYDEVIVDRKQVDDDRIDDLEIRTSERRVRRQIKSSQNESRAIAESDFTGAHSSLRIDRLVLTHVRDKSGGADEYRLSATWQPPLHDDPLHAALQQITADPTVTESSTLHFKLDGQKWWPQDAAPTIAPLLPFVESGAEFGRAEFLSFCDRFVIELKMPAASLNLATPGPLESTLIGALASGVGIGSYPNIGRSPIDVAALAIALATHARTQQATLTPSDIERELAIRTDFGRVAQAFPLDEATYCDRPAFRQTVAAEALRGHHQLIVGPPGAGKSWDITRLADDLRNAGAIVARHYCYLEPGDEQVERRITTDVFFANLLAELVEAAPSLRDAARSRYSAGISEFEETLQAAADLNAPVIIVVDGLDHIARVRAGAPSLAFDETDIVERIASLNIPQGIMFVLGSQPGTHLDPIRERWSGNLLERTIPPWSSEELVELSNCHGVEAALRRFGITDTKAVANVLEDLCTRADGSPLYARYLSQGLVNGIGNGTITSPSSWLNEIPATSGNIAVYYAHLYNTISNDAQIIADVIGVIDFSVSSDDLRQMLPPLVGWIPGALDALAPVLTSTAGQGGFRVFHESFRRFMMDELQRRGRPLDAVLSPVVDWLEKRGFYGDAKSFRFLLPALRRTNRAADIFKYVSASFVADSVAQAHPLDAIERNLALAADVAGRTLNWPALVRCAELQRCASTCFDDGENTWTEYWPAYVEIFGAASLAQRLLFDGKPTQSRSEGLTACSLIDDAGGVAPWAEYLDLPVDDSGSGERDPDDDAMQVFKSDRVGLAVVHGRLRLGQRPRILRRVLAHLRDAGDDIQPGFIRLLGARLSRTLGLPAVARIVQMSTTSTLRRKPLSPQAASMLRLGMADEARRGGDRALCAAIAGTVLQDVESAELALICVELGAPISGALQFVGDPSSLTIAVGPDDYLHQVADLRQWISLVRLAASDVTSGPAVLDHERDRVRGEGWYRCWLRFVIELAVVEAKVLSGEIVSVVPAFQQLTQDMHPFTGKPRACDLYKARLLVRDSIARGLSLITDHSEWAAVLDIVSTVSEKTASRLDREDGGPLPIGSVLDVLQPYVADPKAGPAIRAMIEREVNRCEDIGTYYSTHADYAMRLARARMAAGDRPSALKTWTCASQYLTGYGWRKDATLFDLLGCTPALSTASKAAALNALALAQPLTAAVIRHTDGRSTKHTPNAWFRDLAKVDAPTALAILAETIATDDNGIESWPVVEAIKDSVELTAFVADPVLADAVLSTLVFDPDYESEVGTAANARLAPVERLAQTKPHLVPAALRRVAVEIRDDSRRHKSQALAVLKSTAQKLSVPLQLDDTGPAEQGAQNNTVSASSSQRSDFGQIPALIEPPFPTNPSVVDLLVGLRNFEQGRLSAVPQVWDRVILPLSYHISTLLQTARDDDAFRLLRFFAREIDMMPSGELHPLGRLAEALDNAGHSNLAAAAYALAYTSTRGGGGWLRLGDEKHRGAIDRALILDRPGTLRVVGEEVAYTLNGSIFAAGVSRHLIDRIADWGEPQVACNAWKEAYDVISARLPLAPANGWFSPLTQDALPRWTVDEGLVAVLLGRLSEPRLSRKIRALSGLRRAIVYCPAAMAAPLHWWLSRNSRCSAILLVLDLLLESEQAPYPIARNLTNILSDYAACNLWGLRALASRLLERVGAEVPQWSYTNVEPLQRDPPLTEKRAEAMRSTQVGGALEALSELIPEFSDAVLRRLSYLVGPPKRYQHRFEEEYKLTFGREGKTVPSTPILWWQTELFTVALHEMLSEFYPRIWEQGQWTPELDDELLALILPDIRLHLGLSESRTLRPSWPMPGTMTSGTNEVSTIDNDDAVYAGWIRLAITELQYVRDPLKPYRRPTEKIWLFAGAVAIPPGSEIPDTAFSLINGDWESWLFQLPQWHATRRRAGPLAILKRHTDWLGDRLVLAPPTILEAVATFVKPSIGDPFMWVDESGAPAVVLRTWNVRNVEESYAEPFEIEGSDLIVRPDIAAKLQNVLAFPLTELRDVDRRAVKTDPDDA